MILRVPRQHGVTRAQSQFIEAAQSVGEECIVLSMYRTMIDEESAPRCTSCYDGVYGQGDTENCPYCLGTTFLGGVKNVFRSWSIFTDTDNSEDIRRRGEWAPDEREVQLEAGLTLFENDYVIRILSWRQPGIPDQVGDRYVLRSLSESTLRVGSRYGQIGIDRVAQRGRIQRLTKNDVLYRYSIPQYIPRIDPPPFFRGR